MRFSNEPTVFAQFPVACSGYISECAAQQGTQTSSTRDRTIPAPGSAYRPLQMLPSRCLAYQRFNSRACSPESVYDDPDGGSLRQKMYARLRLHAQFQNERKYFDIAHRKRFGVNVLGRKSTLRFHDYRKRIRRVHH